MRDARRRLRRLTEGFTLLEVMITLAILGMSLVTISQSQQNSMRAVNRAKWITVATMLARYKMVEVEDKLFEEGFSDFEEKETGDFKDDGFEKLTYELQVDKIELPTNMDAQSLENAVGGGSAESGESAPQSSMLSMGTQMLSSQFEMIRNTLEQSIRRVQLKVEWKEGSRTQAVTVVGYFTDPRKIDAASGGGIDPSLLGQGTQTGTGTGTTPPPTTPTTTPRTTGSTR